MKTGSMNKTKGKTAEKSLVSAALKIDCGTQLESCLFFLMKNLSRNGEWLNFKNDT